MRVHHFEQQKCVPCEGGVPPLSRSEAEAFLAEIPAWTLAKDGQSLSREFRFKDFAAALAFANRVGEIAEAENHHPDLHISWGKVRIDLSTHAIGGLSTNDFILAAKISAL